MKSPPSIWHLLHNVKSTVKILSIFVAFLENINFRIKFPGPVKFSELSFPEDSSYLDFTKSQDKFQSLFHEKFTENVVILVWKPMKISFSSLQKFW